MMIMIYSPKIKARTKARIYYQLDLTKRANMWSLVNQVRNPCLDIGCMNDHFNNFTPFLLEMDPAQEFKLVLWWYLPMPLQYFSYFPLHPNSLVFTEADGLKELNSWFSYPLGAHFTWHLIPINS